MSPSNSPRKSVTLSTPDSEADRFFPDLEEEDEEYTEGDGEEENGGMRRRMRRDREARGSMSGMIADDESDGPDHSNSLSYMRPLRNRKQ